MGLNLSKGDMYKFVNYTWNPIKGKCLHDCSYCYMKQINPNANPPRLAEYELNTDLGCGRGIFFWRFPLPPVAGLFLLAVPRICSQKTYHPNGLP